MSEPIAFRVSKTVKQFVEKTLNEIPERFPDVDTKGEALKKVFDIYNERIELSNDDDILDAEIQSVLDRVSCDFLSWESQLNGFMCNEFLYRKKKGDPLGYVPDLVLKRCNDCRKGKAQQKENEIEKMLQKDSMKKILDLRKALMQMLGKGFEVEAFICKGDMFEQNACYFSMDGKHLPCPKADDEKEALPLVSIEDVCKNTINPETLRNPCEHLINLFHRVFIPDFEDIVKKANAEFPQIQEQPQTPKTIEVESKVIESSGGEQE